MYKALHRDNHILSPDAYNIVYKRVKTGAPVLSATQQFTIQLVASQFVSDILYIPKPLSILDFYTYSMDMICDYKLINPDLLLDTLPVLKEIIRFLNFMISNNYYVCGFHMLLDAQNRIALIDFSHVGIFSGNMNTANPLFPIIKFPKDKKLYTFHDALQTHGFRFMCITHPMYIQNDNDNISGSDISGSDIYVNDESKH